MWKYSLPIILTSSFVLCSTLGYFYFIFPIMLVANVLNMIWGEFSNQEIKKELKQYYTHPIAKIIKQVSAISLIVYIAWAVRFVSVNPMSLYALALFTLAAGALTGCFVVTLAHDLLHSEQRLNRILAGGLLLSANIPHLAHEHVYGHHEQLALEEDASTAAYGQNFYSYFWHILQHRLLSSFVNKLRLPHTIWKKILLQNLGMVSLQFLIYATIWFLAPSPLRALVFFLVQGFISYLLYEIINYVQHYGLRRKHIDDAITQALSWNCYYKYTNYILYMLPLHSLHHLPATERRVASDQLTAGPRLPYLYFGMVFLALIPPIWFRTMNPLIAKL